MSDSDLTDGAVPQAPDLTDAKQKLQSATQLLRQLNEDAQAALATPERNADTTEEP